jgi:hypothetical protein
MTDFAMLFSEIFLSLIDRRVSRDQITGLLHLNNYNLSVLKQLAENELLMEVLIVFSMGIILEVLR